MILVPGIVLWLMYFLYLMPQFIFLLLDGFTWIFDAIDIARYIIGILQTGNPASGLGKVIMDAGLGFILKSGFIVFYPIATWPFYRVAMLRYAEERQASIFFQFRDNFKIVKASYPIIMSVYIQDKFVWLTVATVGSLMAATFIAAPVAIGLIFPLRIIVTGLLYRLLAERLGISRRVHS